MKKLLLLTFLIILFSCSAEDAAEETSEKKDPISLTEFGSIVVEEINTNSAVINVVILDDGGSEITERGVYWSKNSNPAVSDNSVMSGSGSEDFGISLKNLEPNSTYYVKAFAKNEAGISYSKVIQFETLEEDGPEMSGIILRTIDGGNTWESIQVDDILNLHSVIFLDKETGYAVGDYGKIIKTENGGKDWVVQNTGNYILNDVFFIDQNKGYAVGNFSKILKTEDGGATWFEQESGTNKELRSVYFLDETTGYIVGNQGVVLRTENAGQDWTTVDDDPYRKSLYAVEFSDPNNGYAAGYDGIYVTTDGGQTWSSQYKGPFSFGDLTLVLDGTAYAVGEQGFVYKKNGGETEWQIIAENLTYRLETVSFVDTKTGYVAGYDGDIFKTTDGGKNWTPQDSGTTYQINSIFFTDVNTGIAVGFMK